MKLYLSPLCIHSLLKIWNVNKCNGVVGVFNCQGAGWCKFEKKTRIHDSSPGILTGSVKSTDVDALTQVAGPDWHGETVVYCQRSGTAPEIYRVRLIWF